MAQLLVHLPKSWKIDLGWLSELFALADWGGGAAAFGDAAYYVGIVIENPNAFATGKFLSKYVKFVLQLFLH